MKMSIEASFRSVVLNFSNPEKYIPKDAVLGPKILAYFEMKIKTKKFGFSSGATQICHWESVRWRPAKNYWSRSYPIK